MLRPNVCPSYLLKLNYLEDTSRVRSKPQETSFPDVEVHSTPPLDQKLLYFLNGSEGVLKSDCFPQHSSFAANQEPFNSLQGGERSNQRKIPDDPNRKQKKVLRARPLFVKLHGLEPKNRLKLSFGSSHILDPAYFAPRCQSTTFAVSKRIARSSVKERCLM